MKYAYIFLKNLLHEGVPQNYYYKSMKCMYEPVKRSVGTQQIAVLNLTVYCSRKIQIISAKVKVTEDGIQNRLLIFFSR